MNELVRKIHLEAGVSTAEIAAMEDEERRATTCLRAKQCPSCKGPITRQVDPRQVGASGVPGVWVNYRCVQKCGYLSDRKEGTN